MTDKFSDIPKEGEAWDTIVVGSGPSALTAAVYTTRGAASTLVLGGEKWGGQLMLTTAVDNFPGFPEGVQGPDLMKKMREQAVRFGGEFREENVLEVDFSSSPFLLKSREGEYRAKSVIVATGADTRWLGAPGEERLIGRGISSCAPCDAPFFKDKKVIVVGGGDSAMEEALVLTKYASEVRIVHRRDEFRASEAMQKKVKNNPKIKIIWNSEIVEFIGGEKLEKVRLKNNKTDEVSELEIDGVFVAIGHTPSSEIFRKALSLDKKGYIKRNPNDKFQMTTNVEGVFVAGDVYDYNYKQAITAAGFGCMAAMDVLKFLDKEGPSY